MLYLIILVLIFSNVFQFVYFYNRLNSNSTAIDNNPENIETVSKLPKTLFSRLYGNK